MFFVKFPLEIPQKSIYNQRKCMFFVKFPLKIAQKIVYNQRKSTIKDVAVITSKHKKR